MDLGPTGAYINGCQLTHTNGSLASTVPTWFSTTFPPQLPMFPGGLPQPVGTIWYINRQGA